MPQFTLPQVETAARRGTKVGSPSTARLPELPSPQGFVLSSAARPCGHFPCFLGVTRTLNEEALRPVPGLTCAGVAAASSLSDSSLLSESSCTSALTCATAGPAFPGGPGVVPFPEGPLVGGEAAFTGRVFPTDFNWNDTEERTITGAKGPMRASPDPAK